MIRRLSNAPMIARFAEQAREAHRELMSLRAVLGEKQAAQEKQRRGYRLDLRDKVALARSVNDHHVTRAADALTLAERRRDALIDAERPITDEDPIGGP